MSQVAYQVLILDDGVGEFGYGESTRMEMRNDSDFQIDLAFSSEEAEEKIKEKIYDIFVVDVYLHRHQDGIKFVEWLRHQGFMQPVILTTDNDAELKVPISTYERVLRDGPTFFVKKGEGGSAGEVIRKAAERSDILLRTLRILSETGQENLDLRIGDRQFSLADLLQAYKEESKHDGPDAELVQARRALRDGIGLLMARWD